MRFCLYDFQVTGCCFLVLGAALQATSFGIGQMIAGRIVAGFGVGFISCTIPMLISEIAQPNRRGILIAALFTLAVVCMLSILCVIGMLILIDWHSNSGFYDIWAS